MSKKTEAIAREHLKVVQPLLAPKARTGCNSPNITDRMLDSRLKGSDLYVARFVSRKQHSLADTSTPEMKASISSAAVSGPPTPSASPIRADLAGSTGSLHDELCFSKDTSMREVAPDPPLPFAATSSRPCYRCISYMEWAGIRRVGRRQSARSC